MRHGKKGNHLGRKAGHRRALLANLACALFTHKRINTTVAKAKALRVYAEPMITKAIRASKTESAASATHHHRVVFSSLQNKDAVKELFGTIAQKVGDRPGGYLRIIKTGFRKGDGADMAMIELVDFNEIYNVKASEGEATAKRTRRGGKRVVVSGSAPAIAAAPVVVTETIVAPVEETTTVVTEVVTTRVEMVDGIDQELLAAGIDESNMTVIKDATTEESQEKTEDPA